MDEKIILKNVRIDYPYLFKRAPHTEKLGSFSVTTILDKVGDKDQIDYLFACLEKHWPDLTTHSLLRDGDAGSIKEYKGSYTVKASSQAPVQLILDEDKNPVYADDNIFYAGCYANVIISLWYSSKYGCINANLLGIQFAGDGPVLQTYAGKQKNIISASFDDFEVLP